LKVFQKYHRKVLPYLFVRMIIVSFGENTYAYGVLDGKLEGREHLDGIWEDHIKMAVKEIGSEGREWIYLA
jgi:hypothetical protein